MYKKDKVSIIIPIYNGEKHLAECLDTIQNQTYTNLEIICINDGSRDKSLSILKEYQKKDDRFIVIDQKMQVRVRRGMKEYAEHLENIFLLLIAMTS